jgi:cob(I)alamin adenosyltransferase
LTRIYTKTGDDGTTGLIGGKRVSKDSPIIEVCGTLDELNAIIGAVRSHQLQARVDRVLHTIQENLFTVCTELATPDGVVGKGGAFSDENIREIEREIDAFENKLQPLKRFVLPGGKPSAAGLHLARTVSRRAERRCVSLSRLERINPKILPYLNRLSDLFFVLARYMNQPQSMLEEYPDSEPSKD